MNRREALALFAGIPEVMRVTRWDVRTRDVIVLEAPCAISEEAAARIREFMERVFPNTTTLVLGDGLTMKVVRDETRT